MGGKVFIEFNATLRNRIEIGEEALLGMGTVVTKSVAKNMTVAGNLAKFFGQLSWGGIYNCYASLLKEAV